MALPDPQLGLVISYSYLWHHEHHAGRDGGPVRPEGEIDPALRRWLQSK